MKVPLLGCLFCLVIGSYLPRWRSAVSVLSGEALISLLADVDVRDGAVWRKGGGLVSFFGGRFEFATFCNFKFVRLGKCEVEAHDIGKALGRRGGLVSLYNFFANVEVLLALAQSPLILVDQSRQAVQSERHLLENSIQQSFDRSFVCPAKYISHLVSGLAVAAGDVCVAFGVEA